MQMTSVDPDWSQTDCAYWWDLWDKTPRDSLYSELHYPTQGAVLSDGAAMFLACAVALKGVGNVSPNPLVGAVILDREARFINAGAHLKVGLAHAEVNALSGISDSALLDGGSIFVTLEPCAHVGRTPSCAHMLAKSSLRRIVYAIKDPNPKVNGQGHFILEAAGKLVQLASSWTTRAEWLARVFLHNQRLNSIFVALKVASTRSGVIAGDQTKRLWITGERARAMGHFLRLEYDAIVIGMGTLKLDDPSLNVRHSKIQGRTPLRIILDPQNQFSGLQGDWKLLSSEPDRTLVILSEGSNAVRRFEGTGVNVLQLPLDDTDKFAWEDIKKALWGMGIRSLLIEGGAGLYQSSLSAKTVDVIHWFAAEDHGQIGLKWPIEDKFINAYDRGSGVALEGDRLLEITL